MSAFDEQSYSIIINGSNLVSSDTSNSTYRFNFNGTKLLENTKLAISNASLFYSWFNITSTFNNRQFQYTFTNNAGTSTFTVTIPEGYYTISQLNSYLQSVMITNGHYLVNGSGQFVYYLEILENSSAYALQVNCYAFPTALPGGWTNPSGVTFPAVASTPQLIINALTTSTFATFTGFNPGTYPPVIQATTYSKLSDVTPKTTPVENVIVRCNLVNNQISNPTDTIYSFSASGTGFGNLINSQPYEFLYLDVCDGYYSSIDISFVDQEYRAIEINDTSIIVQLAFKSLKKTTGLGSGRR
jgi:hypothetical protein